MMRSNHMLLRAGAISTETFQKCRRSDPAPPVPPPAAAGVHARRTHGPCASDLIPCIRGAPARANRAPPCPHTDLLVAHPVQPADPCLAWLSLCVQRRSCVAGSTVDPPASSFCGARGTSLAAPRAGRRPRGTALGHGLVLLVSMLVCDCTRSRGYDVRTLKGVQAPSSTACTHA